MPAELGAKRRCPNCLGDLIFFSSDALSIKYTCPKCRQYITDQRKLRGRST